MMKITIATVLLAAFSTVGVTQASLAASMNEGYLTDSVGNTVKDGNGECVRNSYWTPAMANPACKTAAPPPSSRKVSIMKKDPLNDGYLVDAEGKIARDAEGKCVHTAYWTPSIAIPVCDAVLDKATSSQVAKKAILVEGANFATNSAKLLKTADAKLKEVVSAAKQHPAMRLDVSGHTDNHGKKAHNQKLSESRAAAVKAWLVKHGIAADRIDATGYADSQPIADNKTKAGRAANRRVEVRYVIQHN